MKLLLLCLVTFLCVSTYAQTTLHNGFSVNTAGPQDPKAIEGTFELQRTSKIEAALTTEEYDVMLRLIELERRENESLYVVYSPLLTIYIPSKSELVSK